MSTKILDPKKIRELQPAYALWKLYRPDKAPLRFQARSKAEAESWQKEAREKLREVLGLGVLPDVPLQVKQIEQVDKGDYVREKILLRTSKYTVMPVYILLPKDKPRPLPVALAFHGHGYGVKDIVGLWEDGGERENPEGYQRHFAVMLCKRGFAVAAPEISCFGERTTDFRLKPGQSAPSTCTHTAQLATHLGISALGLRIHDGLKLVDYLATRKDMNLSRLGAMGISGGGMHTFYSTCVDTRIRACVVSGYFCTFRDSIFAMTHCACNYVHGMHIFGEMYDLAGLVAPRPMLVESADHDSIFPQKAVRYAMKRAKAVYNCFGAVHNLKVDYFEGRHQISGRLAYDFLYDAVGGDSNGNR